MPIACADCRFWGSYNVPYFPEIREALGYEVSPPVPVYAERSARCVFGFSG